MTGCIFVCVCVLHKEMVTILKTSIILPKKTVKSTKTKLDSISLF